MALKVGDIAPDFNLADETGQRIQLSTLKGKKVILFFYPKDHTPGCTQEACDFRDHYSRFDQANTAIFGISKDSATTHSKFKQKYSLPFPLLTDHDAEVCINYGVINKKSIFGKTFLGIQRSTFIIDESGKIEALWRKVKVSKHVEQVINAIE